MHVRRSDVVLHESSSRRYYPVADYVKQIPEESLHSSNHFIFLLTDDANAIGEAHEFFPDLKWKYFNRTRHRGSRKVRVCMFHCVNACVQYNVSAIGYFI